MFDARRWIPRAIWGCLALVVVQGVAGQDGAEVGGHPDPKAPSTSTPFAPLFVRIERSEPNGESLWKALKDTTFVYSSNPGVPGFHFEYFAWVPMKKHLSAKEVDYKRLLLEWDGSRSALLTLHAENLPLLGFIDNHAFVLSEEAVWDTNESFRWGFVVDGKHADNYSDPGFAPADTSGFVRFDLSSFLKGVMCEEIPPTQWFRVARTLVVRKSNGTRMSLRFRSPNDALRYGGDLGEVWIRSHTGATECFRAFQRESSTKTRLRVPDGKNLATRLDARRWSPPRKIDRKLDARTVDRVKAAQKLWDNLTSFESDFRSEVDDHIPQMKRREQETAFSMFLHGKNKVFSKGSSGKDAQVREFVREVSEYLRAAVMKIRKNLPKDEAFPDDPAMIWREVEAVLGPQASAVIYRDTGLRLLLEFPSLPDNQKVALCDALGDWGLPPFMGDGSQFNGVMKEPFHEAILRSRWQWPCEPRHTKACVDELRKSRPSSGPESVAIETLIRLDEVPRVPSDAMNRWFDAHVVQSSPLVRRQCLTILSLQPTGRAFLLQRFTDHGDLGEVRKDIANMLRARAVATLKAKRFDFIPEGRCREIMTTIRTAR